MCDDIETDVFKIALSFESGLFAYNRWNCLNFVIKGRKNPVKDLQWAIAVSCLLVTVANIANTPVLGSEAGNAVGNADIPVSLSTVFLAKW